MAAIIFRFEKAKVDWRAHGPLLICKKCNGKGEISAWDYPKHLPVGERGCCGHSIDFYKRAGVHVGNNRYASSGFVQWSAESVSVPCTRCNDGYFTRSRSIRTQWNPPKYESRNYYEKCNNCDDYGMAKAKVSTGFMVATIDTDRWEVYTPSVSPLPASEASSSGCYIATACYGDYDAKEVKVFREFRDKSLQTNLAGRLFVKSYYSVSPVLAEKLKTKPRINLFVRKAILDNLYVVLKEKYSPIALNSFSKAETIEAAAPNGGKCPNCKIGGLSFSHYGKNGAEYYSCVRCGYVVKN